MLDDYEESDDDLPDDYEDADDDLFSEEEDMKIWMPMVMKKTMRMMK